MDLATLLITRAWQCKAKVEVIVWYLARRATHPNLLINTLIIRVDRLSEPGAKPLKTLFQFTNFVQHVLGPTQVKGHTLDLTVTHKDDDWVLPGTVEV